MRCVGALAAAALCLSALSAAASAAPAADTQLVVFQAPTPAASPAAPIKTSRRTSTWPRLRSPLAAAKRKLTMFGNSARFTLKLGTYYFLLYFFTVVYNISNKKLLQSFPFPVTVAALQTLVGIPMFLPIWALKQPRNLRSIDRLRYVYSAVCHALGNVATVYALSAGTVSFTHIVKSAEPLFSAALSLLIMRSRLAVEAYLTLIPIVVGVAIASAQDISFNWTSLTAAMASNFFYQLRMVLAKQNLSESESAKLSAGNAFRVVTLLSFVIIAPLALVLERQQVYRAIVGIQRHGELWVVAQELLVSGASFYLYNEISFWILDLVHPVTLAVGNAIKRVVLIAAAVLFFQSPLDPVGGLGAAIAVGGSLLYGLASQRQNAKQPSRQPSQSQLAANRLPSQSQLVPTVPLSA